jgi:hypothetical protein
MKLRIARGTNDLVRMTKMYCEGLGMEILRSFQNHEGFDGTMIGNPSFSYHLEFTHEHGTKAPSSHSEESLLVFNIPDTAEDFEGYRVVLGHNEWK